MVTIDKRNVSFILESDVYWLVNDTIEKRKTQKTTVELWLCESCFGGVFLGVYQKPTIYTQNNYMGWKKWKIKATHLKPHKNCQLLKNEIDISTRKQKRTAESCTIICLWDVGL